MDHNRWLPALVLALAGAAAYANTWGVPFLLDDALNILDNPSIYSLWPPWAAFFPSAHTGIAGRPLANFSFALNWALSGRATWSYHLLNLCIHVLAGITLYGIVRQTLLSGRLKKRFGSGASWLALLCALLWTLHPLQTQAVTYITQRIESLAGLCYLLTLYCAIRGRGTGRARMWQALSVIAFLCGVGAKEIIVTAPFLVLFHEMVFEDETPWRALKNNRFLYTGLGLGLVLVGMQAAWGRTAAKALSGGASFSALQYLSMQPVAVCRYLCLTAWPKSLSFDYGWPDDGIFGWPYPPWQILGPCGLLTGAGIVAGAWALWKRRPTGFLAAWFFGILSPTSSILPLWCVAAEQRMYLPLAAPLALFTLGGWALAQKMENRLQTRAPLCRAWLLALAGICAALGACTFQRNKDYASEVSIWADAAAKIPANSRAATNLGEALNKAGRIKEAIAPFRGVVDAHPDQAPARVNLASALLQTGDIPGAMREFHEALRIEPGSIPARLGLSDALLSAGKPGEAASISRQALALAPKDPEIRMRLGAALLQQGDLIGALASFREAVGLAPASAKARVNLAAALSRAGDRAGAKAQLQKAVELDPLNASAHANLARLLMQEENWDQVAAHAKTAWDLDPQDAQSCFMAGVALARTGKAVDSLAWFQRAVTLSPDFVQARLNLGKVCFHLGDKGAARAHFEKTLALDPQNKAARDYLNSL